MRHRRRDRLGARPRRCCWRRCGGWNTAAMTAPASPPWWKAVSSGAAPRQARQPGRGAGRATRCPAPPASATRAGPRTARRPSATPTRTARRASAWSTTASSRTTRELRAELEADGQAFETETDTETVAQLVDLLFAAAAWSRSRPPRAAFARLEGAYALALVFAGHPDLWSAPSTARRSRSASARATCISAATAWRWRR